ncbi:MAG: hypothetical protein ACNS61_00050 [Candidatus Wenzhouxiangella sp. M2_3B_020]
MHERFVTGLLTLVLVSPGAMAASGHWIERPDEMHQLWLHDVDLRDDRLRILYATSPSLPQGRRDDWSFNVYLVEVGPGDVPAQHLLYSGQDGRYDALSPMRLRRGHDEALLQVRSDDGKARALETRQLPSGESTGLASLAAAVDDVGSGPMQAATADGNVAFVRTHTGPDRERTVGTIEWVEVAPDGSVTGRGNHRLPDARLQVLGSFAPPDGGVGLVIASTATDDPALDHRRSDSVDHEIGGRTITLNVSGETVLLTTGPDGDDGRRFGAPLAQDVRWSGEQAIPQDLPHERIMEQNGQQMTLQQRAAADYRGQRRLLEGLHGVRIRQTPNGYATLAEATVSRRLEPPAHGWHFIEVGSDSLLREIRIEPLIDRFEVEPTDLHVTDDRIFLLVANKRPRGGDLGFLLALDRDGRLAEQTPVTTDGDDPVALKTLVADASGFWVVGTGRDPDAEQSAIWLGRLDARP